MKALILAAGLGTRLLPHTQALPKPLFPIEGSAVLDRTVALLTKAGVTEIMINTHHLHQKIEAHVSSRQYPVSIQSRFEPKILGTGGAIKNIADFWQDGPLLVVNSDIVTNIDLAEVYRFHARHSHPITMVMHDHQTFNCVSVNPKGFITQFGSLKHPPHRPGERVLAYTGIQVVTPDVIALIPGDGFCDIIDVYKKFLTQEGKIVAYIARNHIWHDIGTPLAFRNVVLEQLAPKAFARLGSPFPTGLFTETHLSGDGSDRKWSRLSNQSVTAVLADHGITSSEKRSEAASYIEIGKHLARQNIPVPAILADDAFSGLVIVEDLGDESLHARALAATGAKEKLALYQKVIDQLILLSTKGEVGFDLRWTYQTETYDREMILEKECRYFIEAFVNGWLGMKIDYDELRPEFETLADLTVSHAVWGLMHRDCQSRNIMWHKDQCYFIDFQGARRGPIQYDLASLLIDPYVALEDTLQAELADYYDQKAALLFPQWKAAWRRGYECCRLTRNLQILGAFGFLSKVKGKPFFARFIPNALETLRKSLSAGTVPEFARLIELVNQIQPITQR